MIKTHHRCNHSRGNHSVEVTSNNSGNEISVGTFSHLGWYFSQRSFDSSSLVFPKGNTLSDHYLMQCWMFGWIQKQFIYFLLKLKLQTLQGYAGQKPCRAAEISSQWSHRRILKDSCLKHLQPVAIRSKYFASLGEKGQWLQTGSHGELVNNGSCSVNAVIATGYSELQNFHIKRRAERH